jgi:MFS family permease
MGVRAYLLRGVVVGLIAGCIVGVASFVFVEPVIDRAVSLESQRVTAEHQRALESAVIQHHGDVAAAVRDVPPPPPDVFSRQTQHLGLILATTLFGLGVGGFFAVAYLVVGRRVPPRTPWQRSLGLAAAMCTGAYLLPFLRFPANPPGVGDPATIDRRTYAYALAIAIGCLGVWAAWRLALHLRERGADQPIRQIAVALVLTATLVAEFVALPANTDPIRVPPDLLWDFRLRSVGVQVLLWSIIGSTFGLLTQTAMAGGRRPWGLRALIRTKERAALRG